MVSHDFFGGFLYVNFFVVFCELLHNFLVWRDFGRLRCVLGVYYGFLADWVVIWVSGRLR